MNDTSISREAVNQVLKDYWKQYSRYPLRSLAAFFFPALGSIFVFFVPPLIIAKLVNILATGNGLTLSSTIGYVTLFATTWLFGEVLWRVGMYLLIKLETTGINSLGKEAFQRLTVRDYDFYTDNFVGSLTKTALAFSRGFETFTDTMVFNVTTNIFPIFFAVIVLGYYSLWLPLILILSITVVMAIAIPIIRRRSKLVSLRHAAGSKMAGGLSDVVTNIFAVKSFAKEKQEEILFSKDVDDYTGKYKKAADFQNNVFDMIMSPLYVATNAIGLIAAIFFTEQLGLQVGTMVVVFSYYSQITRIFWEINHTYRNIESSISEASEFTQLLLNPPVIRDVPNATELKLAKTDVAFNDVNFRYGRVDKGALFLNGFNLTIPGGQRVGLVGPSGGGKTTITKLLLRFADAETGDITIDGQAIHTVSQRSLREAIGYVPQEPLLFHRSLFENIAYGNENATEAEVIHAAKLARADDFIQDLPHRYETLVGERGVKLSGGQRQRVAIARAILKNAPILVLDEATSSLDSESEKYIQEGLWELMKDKTALVIAHRLSTIKHLDRIIVLEQGKIVQDGTHDELVAQEGLYATLWSHQSGGFLNE